MPNSKKYRRLRELLKDLPKPPHRLSPKKLNKTLRSETIGPDPKRN